MNFNLDPNFYYHWHRQKGIYGGPSGLERVCYYYQHASISNSFENDGGTSQSYWKVKNNYVVFWVRLILPLNYPKLERFRSKPQQKRTRVPLLATTEQRGISRPILICVLLLVTAESADS